MQIVTKLVSRDMYVTHATPLSRGRILERCSGHVRPSSARAIEILLR